MVLLLDHLEQEELQVIGLGHAPQDGVIRGLLLHLDLPQLPVGILCGGVQHLDEQLLRGKVRAAGRGQKMWIRDRLFLCDLTGLSYEENWNETPEKVRRASVSYTHLDVYKRQP